MNEVLSHISTIYLANLNDIHVPHHARNTSLMNLAFTDALLTQSGKTKTAFLHFWRSNQPTVILGMLDTSLTYFDKGMAYLKNEDYQPFVRHSGGLAVPSDNETLNFSLIIDNPQENRILIEEGYTLVYQLLRDSFHPFEDRLQAKEVPNSYCPGDFDIVLDGRKIAGLAQRRTKDGLAIMGYISVNGDQEKRARLIQSFYQIAKGTEPSQKRYPMIDPEVMTTVADKIPSIQTADHLEKRMIQALRTYGITAETTHLPTDLQEAYESSLNKLIKRNQKMLGQLFEKEVFT